MRRHHSFHHKLVAIFLSLSLTLFNSVSFATPLPPSLRGDVPNEAEAISIPDDLRDIETTLWLSNAILDQPINPESFAVDEQFLQTLQQTETFRTTVEKWKSLGASVQATPYSFFFYYPGQKELYLRTGKQIEQVAPKLADDSQINGPAAVFIQAAVESSNPDY